jgi:hypothetical protein
MRQALVDNPGAEFSNRESTNDQSMASVRQVFGSCFQYRLEDSDVAVTDC